MPDFQHDFDLTPGQIWFNSASEGPLPKVSAKALAEAVAWKSSPEQLTIPKFQQIPILLKKSLAHFCRLPQEGIILGNSATYGVHLLANGLPFESGDEIILMCNDFPTDILPWLFLRKRGVIIHQLKGKGPVLTVDEIRSVINSRTRLICLPLVHTFSGWKLDIAAIAALASTRGIYMAVNMSQAYGAMDVDVQQMGVDAIVCAGYKWLLGPYGTGFCWVNARMLDALDYPQAYWISLMDEVSLASTAAIELKEDKTARRYDVFGTANFFNYVPWRMSIDYLDGIGVRVIEAHNQQLIDQFCQELNRGWYILLSPEQKQWRSNLVVFSHKNQGFNVRIYGALKSEGIHLAFWKGCLRFSPHVFNNSGQVQKLIEVLNRYDAK